jgi:hypothetical protein
MTSTDHAPACNRAAQWLLAEFDATDTASLAVYDEYADDYQLPYYVQPMFQLKDDMEPGAGMHVTPSDYRDPGRYWL